MSPSSGPPDRLRLAVVGCGAVFERLHLPAIAQSDEWIVVAASETDRDRQRWLERVLPETVIHESLDEMARSSRPDAIMILTPAHSHAELATAALLEGVPTFVEKPMATDTESALWILETSTRGRVPVQVGFNRRMRQTYRTLRREIESRGVPNRLSYRFLSDGRQWNATWPRPETEALQEIGVHGADLLPWLLRSHPKRVRARSLASAEVQVEIDFATNVSTRIHAGVSDRYEERLVAEWPSATLVAHPGGILRTSGLPRRVREFAVRAHALSGQVNRRLRRRPGLTEESFRRQLRAFASRTRGEPEPAAAAAEDGFRAVQIIEAAGDSLRSHGVWMDLATTRFGSDREEAR